MRCSFCGKQLDGSAFTVPGGAAFCSAAHQWSFQEQEARASLGSLLLHVQAANAVSRVAMPFERVWGCLERLRQSRPASYRSAAGFLKPAAFPDWPLMPQGLDAWLPSMPAGAGAQPLDEPRLAPPPALDFAMPFELAAFAGPPPEYPVFAFTPLRHRYCFAREGND